MLAADYNYVPLFQVTPDCNLTYFIDSASSFFDSSLYIINTFLFVLFGGFSPSTDVVDLLSRVRPCVLYFIA
jgi:hypothetical protein